MPRSTNQPALAYPELDRSKHRFGYITPPDGSKDVNVRSGDIHRDGGYKALSEGQQVEFEVSKRPQGPQAKNVRVVD